MIIKTRLGHKTQFNKALSHPQHLVLLPKGAAVLLLTHLHAAFSPFIFHHFIGTGSWKLLSKNNSFKKKAVFSAEAHKQFYQCI